MKLRACCGGNHLDGLHEESSWIDIVEKAGIEAKLFEDIFNSTVRKEGYLDGLDVKLLKLLLVEDVQRAIAVALGTFNDKRVYVVDRSHPGLKIAECYVLTDNAKYYPTDMLCSADHVAICISFVNELPVKN